MGEFIFSSSAGRTGTAWIADFLAENLKITSMHKSLGINDFGIQMPDIETMRILMTEG